MNIYRCIEEFKVPKVGDDGFDTGEYYFVEVDSLWILEEGISYVGGRNHLKSDDILGASPSWIEISDETLAQCFEEEGGDMT